MKTPNINSILRNNPVSCRYGAPMGARNYHNFIDPIPGIDEFSPCYLQRIRFVDGDYAPDGTYWGVSSPLWCAFNDDTRIYIRAKNRAFAVAALLDMYHNITFFRGAK